MKTPTHSLIVIGLMCFLAQILLSIITYRDTIQKQILTEALNRNTSLLVQNQNKDFVSMHTGAELIGHIREVEQKRTSLNYMSE